MHCWKHVQTQQKNKKNLFTKLGTYDFVLYLHFVSFYYHLQPTIQFVYFLSKDALQFWHHCNFYNNFFNV